MQGSPWKSGASNPAFWHSVLACLGAGVWPPEWIWNSKGIHPRRLTCASQVGKGAVNFGGVGISLPGPKTAPCLLKIRGCGERGAGLNLRAFWPGLTETNSDFNACSMCGTRARRILSVSPRAGKIVQSRGGFASDDRFGRGTGRWPGD